MPALWDEMELAVDTCLEAHDRKSIRKFLKRDVDGNERLAVSASFKEYYGKNPSATSMEAINAKVLSHQSPSPNPNANPNSSDTSAHAGKQPPKKTVAINPLHMGPAPGLGPAGPGQHQRPQTAPDAHGTAQAHKKRKPLDPGMTKPLTLAEGQLVGAVSTNKDGRAFKARTAGEAEMERILLGVEGAQQAHSRDSAAMQRGTSLPYLQKPSSRGGDDREESNMDDSRLQSDANPNVTRPRTTAGPPLAPLEAWGGDMMLPKNNGHRKPGAPGASNNQNTGNNNNNNNNNNIYGDANDTYAGLPGDSAVAMGLMRVADVLVRKVLPWQAVSCPRAVECLRDSR